MSLKVSYLSRETFQNLWRNISLTIAAIITVIVSLTMFGTSLMVRDGVDNATERWEGGIEFVIWMNPDATAEQDDAIEQQLQDLEELGQIDRIEYFDQAAAFDEFQEMFSDSPETLAAVTQEDLPPSYRVVPSDPDALVIEELARQFDGLPGVRDVVLATEVIKEVQRTADRIALVTIGFGIVLVVAAVLLILNTIIMAINARSREIEVMKLVGASNWFIRLPFIFEGFLFGLIGALISIPALAVIRTYVLEPISDSDTILLLQGFGVTDSQFRTIVIINLVLGTVVSAVGSGVAVSRHLDV